MYNKCPAETFVMWPGQGQWLPNVYPSHPTMWPEEFGVGGPCNDVLTKSTLSRQSCAHLVPPLLSPLSCLPLPLLRSPVLLSCSSPRVSYSFEVRGVLETYFALSDISSLTATMVHSSSICRVLLLVLLGLLVAFVHTGKPPFQCD